MTKATGANRKRGVDHLVVCVDRLEAARQRLTAMGLKVQGDARHPFGTGNACVMFANGTYLEPLAVLDREGVGAAIVAGNQFCRRQDAYRFRHGRGGAMLAVKTADAEKALARFVEAGLDGGKMLDFRRPQELADGSTRQVGVRLAFSRDDRAGDMTIFACEHLAADILFSVERTTHENGASGITSVIFAEENPTDFQFLFQTTLDDRDPRASSLGLRFEMDDCDLEILTPLAEEAFLGTTPTAPERGPRLVGAVIGVPDLAAQEARLAAAGIAFETRSGRLVVPGNDDFALALAFEELQS